MNNVRAKSLLERKWLQTKNRNTIPKVREREAEREEERKKENPVFEKK